MNIRIILFCGMLTAAVCVADKEVPARPAKTPRAKPNAAAASERAAREAADKAAASTTEASGSADAAQSSATEASRSAGSAASSARAAQTEREVATRQLEAVRQAEYGRAARMRTPRPQRAVTVPKEPQECQDKGAYLVSAVHGSGFNLERVVTTAVVCVTDLNPVRFSYSLKPSVSMIADPDLAGIPFVPGIPASGTPTTGEEKHETPAAAIATRNAITREPAPREDRVNALEDDFAQIRAEVNRLGSGEAGDALTALKRRLTEVLEFTRRARDETDAFRKEKAPRHRSATFTGLVRLLDALIYPVTDGGEGGYDWPHDLELRLQDMTGDLRTRLEALPGRYSDVWEPWLAVADHGAVYKQLLARVAEVQQFVASLEEKRNQHGEVVKGLVEVGQHFEAILSAEKDPFTIVFRQPCGVLGRRTELKLHQLDLIDASTHEVTLLTLECPSPLSISGGIGLSTIDERDYGLAAPPAPVQPAATPAAEGGGTDEAPQAATGAVINLNNSSRFHPVPLLLVNVRLLPLGRWLALHYSFGAGVNLTDSTLGTDMEFLTGPSISVADRLFITAGPQLGRTNELLPGFQTGPPGYVGLQSAPVHKRFNVGLGIAFTYKLR